MTNWVNPTTRIGGVDQIVVAERPATNQVDDAPFDDEQYVRVNGEWVPYLAPPIVPDTLHPKPPTSLASAPTIVSNGTRVNYQLSWAAPTQNTDNTPLTDFAYYVIRWRYAIGGAFQSFVTNDTTFLLDNLTLGSNVEWQVLARDTSGNDSTWATNTITGATDTNGPATPSTPVLSSRLGTITIAWDGKDSVGTAMAPDFASLEIYTSSTTGGPWTYLDRMAGAGSKVDLGVLIGTTRFYSFIAKDASGNSSLRSAEASIVVVGVTGPDMVANTVTANEIDSGYVYTGSLVANQIDSGTITADLTISGSFSTALTGQRSVMDGFGIRQYGPDGNSVITDLPNSGNPRFSGIVNAFGLIVNGGLEFRGQNNQFAMGSVVTMATTTAGSPISPNITPSWETLDSGINAYLLGLRGYHREADGANPTHVTNFFSYSGIVHNTFRYNWPGIVSAEGTSRSTRSIAASTMIRTAGGQRYVTAGDHCANGGSAVWKFEILNLAPMTANNIAPTSVFIAPFVGNLGSYVVNHSMGRCFSPIGSGALENNFASAELQVLPTPDTITFRRFACTDTSITQQGSNVVVPTPMPEGSTANGGVMYGSSAKMGFPGADQNVWVYFGDTKAYVWTAAGVRLPDFDFPIPGNQLGIAVGSTAAGTNGFSRFESTTWTGSGITTTQVPTTRYENIHWDSSSPSVWWACYTWRDNVGTVHESDMSAISSTTMPKRMRYTLTAPNLPDPQAGAGTVPAADDVNGVYFYMARKATLPVRTEMWKQTAQPANGVVSMTYAAMPQFASTTNPPITTNFPAQAASKFQSSALGADGLPKVLITGDGLLHGESLDVSGLGSAALTGKAFEQLYYSIRAQSLLVGGGVLTVDASYTVKWSARFLPISIGRSANLATSGYFDITMPPAGTVITGYGGASNKTVTAAGIPLSNGWDALWYQLPHGSTTTMIPGNFKVTNYSTDFVVPNDWILICVRNADSSRIEFTTGDKVSPGYDTADPASSSSALTAFTGWSMTNQGSIRTGRMLQHNFAITRTGAQLAGNTTGNIGNAQIASAAAAWQPYQIVGITGNKSDSSFMWGGYMNETGGLYVTVMPPNVNIDTGDVLAGTLVAIHKI